MAFFDTATQKVTDFCLVVKDKSVVVADKVKLNANLSKEKKALKDIYAEIGMKYVRANPDDSGDEMGLLVKSAQDCEKRIEELEEKIREA